MVKSVFVTMFITSRLLRVARRTALCCIVSLVLTACSDGMEEKTVIVEKEEPMGTIVAVGDSLTAGYGVEESAGYPAQLQQKLQTAGINYRVVNSGVSGETSTGTLARMEWVLTLEPDIVLLETGANDGLRGLDPQLVEDNLRTILQLLQEREVVVVLTGMRMVWNMGADYVEQFNSIYPRLADEFNVIFQPFFLEGIAMKPEFNLSDGIHPNGSGYTKITDNLYPHVLEAISRIKSREGR